MALWAALALARIRGGKKIYIFALGNQLEVDKFHEGKK